MKPRHENKYSVNSCDILLMKRRLGQFAEKDANSGDDGAYVVKSLYFDNYADNALREKTDGLNYREKFRIRFYNDDTSFIRLEKKSKLHGLCFKESVRLSEDDCRRIIEGDTDFLAESSRPLFKELYAKIKFGLLRPKSIVVYRRECFVYPLGNVRITFDTNIRGSSFTDDFLSPGLCAPVYCGKSILEVKWDEYLPEIIKKCVCLNGRSLAAFSKYVAVRQ